MKRFWLLMLAYVLIVAVAFAIAYAVTGNGAHSFRAAALPAVACTTALYVVLVVRERRK